MECREFLLRYSEYDDSLIPAWEANRFRSHMAECASCARYDRVLRKGRMLARQLPRVEVGDDFIPRLRLRLRGTGVRRRGGPGARLALGLAAATVVMVAAAAVRVMDGAPSAGSVPGAANAAGTRIHGVAAPGNGPETAPAPGRRVGTRVVALPSVDGPAAPRAWGDREVAPSAAAPYSPLETGPPAYRMAGPSVPNVNPDHRALD